MKKVIVVFLCLLLVFSTAFKAFGAGQEESGSDGYEVNGGLPDYTFGVICAGLCGVAVLLLFISPFFSEADHPDDGIKMVSTDDSTEYGGIEKVKFEGIENDKYKGIKMIKTMEKLKTDDKSILNVLQHVETGISPNNDVYVGLRFQY